MAEVKIRINGMELLARGGQTVLEAALENDIHIPTLCFLKDCCGVAECRMCIVEAVGHSRPLTACNTPVQEGMEIFTDSERVCEYRRRSLELMCRGHRMDCEYCSRYSDCELHALMRELGLDDRKYSRYRDGRITDESLAGFGLDLSKCVLCRRCVESCKKQGMNILTVLGRGREARIGSYSSLADTDCIQCGQCLASCPTGALYERNDMMTLWNALEKGLDVAFILTPEVGAVIGECFGEAVGADCEARLIGVLRRMGIKRIYAQHEGETERVEDELSISARCPAVTELIRRRYAPLEKYISSNVKTPLAQTVDIVRSIGTEAFVVAVGPCSAGKSHGFGADLYVTVTELASFIRRGCVSRFTAMEIWKNTAPAGFDALPCCGAGVSANKVKTDKMKEVIAYLDKMLSGEINRGSYELLACEGGCMMGGGRPRLSGEQRSVGAKRLYHIKK